MNGYVRQADDVSFSPLAEPIRFGAQQDLSVAISPYKFGAKFSVKFSLHVDCTSLIFSGESQ
jgi:hypothetical protein